VILTPEAHDSQWVNREILLADQWKKAKFPILLDGEVSKDYPLWLMFVERQYEDVRGGLMPSADFYNQLAQWAARKHGHGKDVTTIPSTISNNTELQKEINNPPPSKEFTTPESLGTRIPRQPNPDSKRGCKFDFQLIIMLVMGFITACAAIIIAPSLLQQANDTAATQAALALTPPPTETPSITSTPENTSTPTMTLEIAQIVGTMDAQATLDQPTIDFNNTAAARLTAYFAGTQSSFDQTSTATLWTATPTPNITASIDAFRTQQAATATAQYFVSLTETATQWTATPTITLTPTITPTLPPITLATTPIATNANWTPYSARFNGVDMVLVPAGCFTMGDLNGESDETPTTDVCFIEPFWIDQYEVTNAQFIQLGGVAANGGRWLGENRPRESVTWFEAYDFCALRGGRLPTEAEWEYAARGPDDLIYPWGDTFFALNVVYTVNANGQTGDVGSFNRGVSWVGAFDMSGNVWEWVNTLYRPYPYPTDVSHNVNDIVINSSGDTTGHRVIRGGAWNSDVMFLRATNRTGAAPVSWGSSKGFRCARDVEN
jgi:formylglycine-generating enzyme required for sulfatase activity